MNKRRFLAAAAAVGVLAAVWFWASPIVAMHGLRDALMEGDRNELAERVDFPAVRESLKAQMMAAMTAEMAKDKSNDGFAGLGMMFATAFVGSMIDAMVTPDGIKALVDRGKLEKPGEAAPQPTSKPIEWAIDRDEFDRFPAFQRGERTDGAAIVFKREGFSWTMTDIQIPKNGLGPEASAAVK